MTTPELSQYGNPEYIAHELEQICGWDDPVFTKVLSQFPAVAENFLTLQKQANESFHDGQKQIRLYCLQGADHVYIGHMFTEIAVISDIQNEIHTLRIGAYDESHGPNDLVLERIASTKAEPSQRDELGLQVARATVRELKLSEEEMSAIGQYIAARKYADAQIVDCIDLENRAHILRKDAEETVNKGIKNLARVFWKPE